jgi:hypothetical protein
VQCGEDIAGSKRDKRHHANAETEGNGEYRTHRQRTEKGVEIGLTGQNFPDIGGLLLGHGYTVTLT